MAPHVYGFRLYNPFRRFAITGKETSDFVFVELVRIASDSTGMDVTAFKKEHLLKRFRALADKLNCEELADLIPLFKAKPEALRVIPEFIPLGFTEFFRDPSAFDLTLDYFKTFPDRFCGRRTYKLLSAGCGTGEEAVSLSCVALQTFTKINCDFSLQGVDLAEGRIEIARKGIYYVKNAAIPDYYSKEGYFTQPKSGILQPSPKVRQCITYETGNFFTERFAKEHSCEFDFVACRYILSSMTVPAIKSALPHLLAAIRPKGLLWLAVGEFIDNPAAYGLMLIDSNLYEICLKVDGGLFENPVFC